MVTAIEKARRPGESVRQHLAAEGAEEVLESAQWLPCPLEHLFPFFADPYNLEEITPPFLHFAVLRVSPGAMRRGTLIDYRLRLRGVPISWRTRIDVWEPPHRFVDLQVYGPYDLWHHTHEFERSGGGTVVRDRVRYRLPLGALGALVAGRWVRRDLDRIFLYRQAAMRDLFAARGAAPPRAGGERGGR